ncbi:hypothetical protein BC829DRAFT_89591 [Chytridium lagenaria]|nr:hypothetical protein BC829DRAFT_89591 [Chytridium lagenaria]
MGSTLSTTATTTSPQDAAAVDSASGRGARAGGGGINGQNPSAANNGGGAATQPIMEDIPLTPTGANATLTATPEPIAAAYFGESSTMYFGPHFIVNSSDLTSPFPVFPEDLSASVDRRGGVMSRFRGWRRDENVADIEAVGVVPSVEAGNAVFTLDSVRGNVFWPDLITGGADGEPLRGVPGVGVRSDITDEELALIRSLYKQPPPSEVRVTTTLQCLTNLKKNTLRLVPAHPIDHERPSNALPKIMLRQPTP